MKLLVFLFLVMFAFPVSAQETELPTPTRVEVDADASVIRMIVEGREVAQFTSSGLLVLGDVHFGGTMKDHGSDGIEFKMNASRSSDSTGEGDAP